MPPPLDQPSERNRNDQRGSAQNWKLTLSYDGTHFAGWQVQPGHTTVQGTLAEAIRRVTGESVLPQGSGRTDRGVHALAQVASVSLAAGIPPENFARALNRVLPPAVRVLAAEHAPPGFHARHSAASKLYEYRVFRAEFCSPFLASYVYACRWPLALAPMQQAAAAVVGEHDFASFAAHEPDRAARTRAECEAEDDGAGTVRTILSSEWVEHDGPEGPELHYQVHGTGFLHHMVRNLVGTFLDVGRGYRQAGSIAATLAARDRRAAGPTAPARGLFLVRVTYTPAAPAQEQTAAVLRS